MSEATVAPPSSITVNTPQEVGPESRLVRGKKAKHQKTPARPAPVVLEAADTAPAAYEPDTYPEGVRKLVGVTMERIDSVLRAGQVYNYWACYQSQTGAPPDWAWQPGLRARVRDSMVAKLHDGSYLRELILGLIAAREGLFTPDMLARVILSKTGEVSFYEQVLQTPVQES